MFNNNFERNLEEEEQKHKQAMKDLYSPKQAFGNEKLLTEIKILENIGNEKEARKNCKICDGNGFTNEICDQCGGKGVIRSSCSHT